MARVVILGGGIAGTSTAEELRKLDADSEITIIEQEQHPLYSRVLLPHYIKGKVAREKVFLKSEGWYHAHRIEWLAGERVTEIDAKNRFVRVLNGDREIGFDRLVLATGGELVLLPEDMRGVSYLRGVDDADLFLSLLKDSPLRERNGVVYGGGFIAFEYINFFAHYGLPCTVMMRGSGFFSSVLSPQSQRVIADYVTQRGVVLLTEEPMPELIGGDRLEAVRGKDGRELPAFILGVGIGIHPERHVFERAGIEVSRGVMTNEYFETQQANVYAIGDGAEFFDIHAARQVVYGNWMNAQMQGRHLAKILHGERAPFALVSSYATNVLGLHVAFIGDVDRKAADDIRQVSVGEGVAQERYYRNGKLVGAVLVGDLADRMAVTQEIKGTVRE